MFRAVRWFIINGLFVTALYFGFIEQIGGAKNVALIYAWFCITISFLVQIDTIADSVAKEKHNIISVPLWINDCLDHFVVAFFAWFGCWIIAIFYLIHIYLIKAFVEKVKELKEKPPQ
jgi:hypothetical protein